MSIFVRRRVNPGPAYRWPSRANWPRRATGHAAHWDHAHPPAPTDLKPDSQLFTLQVVVVAVVLLAGRATAYLVDHQCSQDSTGDIVLVITRTVATIPLVRSTLTPPLASPSKVLQRYTKQMRRVTGRTCYSLPTPNVIGKPFVGNIRAALAGGVDDAVHVTAKPDWGGQPGAGPLGRARSRNGVDATRPHRSAGTDRQARHGGGLAEALRSQVHDAANRLPSVISLIELRRTYEALTFATAELTWPNISPIWSSTRSRASSGDTAAGKATDQLASEVAYSQQDLDYVLATLRENDSNILLKGLSSESLDAVVVVMRPSAEGLSATEVAGVLRASRLTARRYLEHFADSALAVKRSRYGGAARTEVEYPWIGR